MNLKKIDIYYILTLLFLLLSANASVISGSDIGWGFVLLMMVIVAISKKLFNVKNLKVIGIFSIVYLAFVVIRDLFINSLDTSFLLSDVFFLLKYILLTYVYCIILKEKVAAYLIKVVVHLTILSFCFYFFQLIGLGEYIYNLSSSLNLQNNYYIEGYTNFILFSFTKGQHEYRNSGFAWEPGSFGCFLVITLMLNFFLNNFTFDKKSKILIIGILTTLSTSDYLALLILLFCAYRYRIPGVNRWLWLIIPLSVALFILVPFLGNKISDVYNGDLDDLNHLKFLSKFYKHYNQQIPLNRFSSMSYIYDAFGANLILGVSNKYDAILSKGYSVNISNGIFDFLAKFGLVGFVYLIYNYSKFCLVFIVKWEYLLYCIVILLLISFGEPILFFPLVLMFIFIQSNQKSLEKLRMEPLKKFNL